MVVASVGDLTGVVEELQRTVRALEARVAALEGTAAPGQPALAATAAVTIRVSSAARSAPVQSRTPPRDRPYGASHHVLRAKL
mgnify:CR=1 FL=1